MRGRDPLLVYHLDDDPDALTLCQTLLMAHWPDGPLRIIPFSDPHRMLERATEKAPDLALFDYRLGAAGTAAAYIPGFRRAAPKSIVIVLSELLSGDAARAAFAARADDYVARCGDAATLASHLHAAFRLARSRRRAQPRQSHAVGAGQTMRQLAARVERLVASAVSGIHIHGESGTGKEVVAELFRRHAVGVPFVTVNCAALAPTLLEAELFGAVRGAYTGAQTDRRGVFEAAHRGWLFLDEVACLTTTAQAALLRAVENQEIVRVGDTRPIKVNVRILSATNEDLGALVAAGRFRRDLWQRLCETTLILPPLSARRQEIPELIDHLARELPGGPFEVTPVAKRLLADLDWRDGNIRQLRNCLRAMTEHQTNGILCPQAIPASYLRPLPRSTLGALATTPTKWVDAAFTSAVTQLRATHGPLSVRQMALHLGMSKSAVARRLRSKPH